MAHLRWYQECPMSSSIVIRCLRLVAGSPYRVWTVNTPEYARKHRDIPSAITALSQIVVSRQASEADRDEQHHQPEERTVSTDAWASVFRASVETFATFARRVRDFPVRGQFVPRVIRTTLAFGVRISW